MILECLILREGITPVILGSSKVKYNFMPIPGSKKGEVTTSVCEVVKYEDVNYLLKTGQYREYDADRAYQDMTRRRIEEEVKPYLGFKLEKYHELGYIVIDLRKSKKRYLDTSGWKDDPANLIPFKSDIEAYESLKEEVQFEEMDKNEPETSYEKMADPIPSGEISAKGQEALDKIVGGEVSGESKTKREHYKRIPRQ